MLADAQLSRSPPGLGLNRWDTDNPLTFTASVATAERLGVTCALLGTNPLRVFDPYVCLSLASLQTASITLALFVENPVLRHPAVVASSISTVSQVSNGRAQLVYRAGDTAVRWLGRKPASAAALRAALGHIRDGAYEAGRDPGDVRIGIVLHVVSDRSPARTAAITRAMAAGFYEYTPGLFAAAGVN